MKKIFVGSLVGGIIIFALQFLSWVILDLQRPAQQYTPKQDEILSYLSTQFDSSGGYFLPNTPPGASSDEQTKAMQDAMGKPWAQIYYHKTMDANMTMNMVRSLITDIIIVMLFCWIIAGYAANSFGKTFLAAIFTGLIVYLQASYTNHIWYETFDSGAYLINYLVTWAALGIWLGWFLNRGKA